MLYVKLTILDILSFRVCGFGVKESAELAKISLTSVRNWRKDDPEFESLDLTGTSELKKKLGAEFLSIEFTRNFHLAMQKDLDVLSKSIKNPDGMTDGENKYLNNIRKFYTPQQFAIIQQLVGETKGDNLNFTELVFSIRREREELTVEGFKRRVIPEELDDEYNT